MLLELQMRQYLKIQDPDGIVYFNKFKYADISVMCGAFGMRFLNIEIITLDGPYSEEELQRLRAKQLGNEFLGNVEYAHVQLRHFPCNFRSLDDFLARPIRIEQGYGINIYPDTDPIAYCYLGWSVELLHSELQLKKSPNGSYYLHWTANNAGYLSQVGGKADLMDLQVCVDPHFLKSSLILDSSVDFWIHSAKKKELNDLYFGIFQALQYGSPPPEGIDIGIIPRGTTPIENSKIAWDNALMYYGAS